MKYNNKKTFILHKDWWDELFTLEKTVRPEALRMLVEYGFSGDYTQHSDAVIHNFIVRCKYKMERDFANYEAYMQKHGFKV